MNRDQPSGSEALKLSRLKLILPPPPKKKTRGRASGAAMCRSSSRLLCPWQETVCVHADVRMFPSDQYPPTGPRANRAARTGASCLSRSARTDGSANAVAKQRLPSSATASRLEMRLGVTVQLPVGFHRCQARCHAGANKAVCASILPQPWGVSSSSLGRLPCFP